MNSKYPCLKGWPIDPVYKQSVYAVKDNDGPSWDKIVNLPINLFYSSNFLAVKLAFMFQKNSTYLSKFNEALNRVQAGFSRITQRYKLPNVEVEHLIFLMPIIKKI